MYQISRYLRATMEKRLLELRDIALYTRKIAYNAQEGLSKAFVGFPWALALKIVLWGLLASIIAYGEVSFGDRVRITKGFYKGCVGTAIVQFPADTGQVLLQDVRCGEGRINRLWAIPSDLEVIHE
jgi:hypothetical protein